MRTFTRNDADAVLQKAYDNWPERHPTRFPCAVGGALAPLLHTEFCTRYGIAIVPTAPRVPTASKVPTAPRVPTTDDTNEEVHRLRSVDETDETWRTFINYLGGAFRDDFQSNELLYIVVELANMRFTSNGLNASNGSTSNSDDRQTYESILDTTIYGDKTVDMVDMVDMVHTVDMINQSSHNMACIWIACLYAVYVSADFYFYASLPPSSPSSCALQTVPRISREGTERKDTMYHSSHEMPRERQVRRDLIHLILMLRDVRRRLVDHLLHEEGVSPDRIRRYVERVERLFPIDRR